MAAKAEEPYGDHAACPLCAPVQAGPAARTSEEALEDLLADPAALAGEEPRGDHAECPRCVPARQTVPPTVAIAVLTAAQQAELNSWGRNPLINPETGHAIKEGGPTFAKLEKRYNAWLQSTDAVEVDRLNQQQAASALDRDLRSCVHITRVHDGKVQACEAISQRSRMHDVWAQACKVQAGQLVCRGCSAACSLAVKRAECHACHAVAANVSRCSCQTVWTVACKKCQWECSKPFRSFTTTQAELQAYIQSVSRA